MGKGWEELSLTEIEEQKKVDFDHGLSEEEAKKRREEFGENVLREEKKRSVLSIFFEQWKDPFIYILLAAVAFTAGISVYETVKAVNAGIPFDFFTVGDWPDVVVILLVVTLNAVIGTVQEVKANSSIESLKRLTSQETVVIREGKKKRVPASSLVIGDLVDLEEGDSIPADVRWVKTYSLRVDESSLTGESLPISKDADAICASSTPLAERFNMGYRGTNVSSGRGIAVVVNIGMDTELGKIAGEMKRIPADSTPLQKALGRLSKALGLLTIGMVILVLAVDILWIFIDGNGSNLEAYVEALLSSISLAVAAVPEGLAAVVSLVLSLGVRRMVKSRAIVRKLASVETLGCVSVVCSDKTGTLTQNRMEVVDSFAMDSSAKSLLSKGMALCSNATLELGDPTEIALLRFASKQGYSLEELQKEYPRSGELPFDSIRKRMSVLLSYQGTGVQFTKGALDSLLPLCTHVLRGGRMEPIAAKDKETIRKKNEEFSSSALRVLALGVRKTGELGEEGLTFIGMTAMKDPPRKEAYGAVETLQRAGVRTVMITGDHKDTAYAIAKELGIAKRPYEVLTGEEIDALSEEGLRQRVRSASVYARVSPMNKVQIVRSLKGNGNIVAMTGDGVNDAPSLMEADIGIAMGITGTDVAKGAADLVLTDDNFASIALAAEEGRSIYQNIKKTVWFLLSSNLTEVMGMFVLLSLGLPMPMLAIHLLFVNLITDSLPAIALGVHPKEEGLMEQKPRNPKESLFARGGVSTILGYGAILTLGMMLAYFVPAFSHGAFTYSAIKTLYLDPSVLNEAQTMAFTSLALSELFHMLGMGDLTHSIFAKHKQKNGWMILAFALGVGLQIAVVEIPFLNSLFQTTPLGWENWLKILLIALLPLLAHEIQAVVRYLWRKHQKGKVEVVG